MSTPESLSEHTNDARAALIDALRDVLTATKELKEDADIQRCAQQILLTISAPAEDFQGGSEKRVMSWDDVRALCREALEELLPNTYAPVLPSTLALFLSAVDVAEASVPLYTPPTPFE